MDVLEAVSRVGSIPLDSDVYPPRRKDLVEALRAVRAVEEWADTMRAALLAECRRSHWGYEKGAHGRVSVDEIAEALGVSRSAAGRLMSDAVKRRKAGPIRA